MVQEPLSGVRSDFLHFSLFFGMRLIFSLSVWLYITGCAFCVTNQVQLAWGRSQDKKHPDVFHTRPTTVAEVNKANIWMMLTWNQTNKQTKKTIKYSKVPVSQFIKYTTIRGWFLMWVLIYQSGNAVLLFGCENQIFKALNGLILSETTQRPTWLQSRSFSRTFSHAKLNYVCFIAEVLWRRKTPEHLYTEGLGHHKQTCLPHREISENMLCTTRTLPAENKDKPLSTAMFTPHMMWILVSA